MRMCRIVFCRVPSSFVTYKTDIICTCITVLHAERKPRFLNISTDNTKNVKFDEEIFTRHGSHDHAYTARSRVMREENYQYILRGKNGVDVTATPCKKSIHDPRVPRKMMMCRDPLDLAVETSRQLASTSSHA